MGCFFKADQHAAPFGIEAAQASERMYFDLRVLEFGRDQGFELLCGLGVLTVADAVLARAVALGFQGETGVSKPGQFQHRQAPFGRLVI